MLQTPRRFTRSAFFVGVFVLWTTHTAEAADSKVRVAIPSESMAQIAFYVGREKGYYEQEGLDVELILMRAPVANLSLIGGDVNFSTVPAAALNAALRGAPLRVVYSTFYRPMHWLYAQPHIRGVKDLRNKRIGVDGRGGAMEMLMREILERNGIKDEKSTPLLALGVQSNRFTALESGVVDATILTFPLNFTAESAGFRQLASFLEHDEMVQLAGTLVLREPVSDRSSVEKFLRGTMKGFLFTRANRAETAGILGRRIKIKNDVALRIYDLARPGMSPDGTVPEDLQKKVLDQTVELVGLKQSPPTQKFFDFSMVKKVRAELEAAKWTPGK
jgi:ABC-type nitrate/sulfonate/bicarbonate transport system substrate-binding protein